MAQEILSLGTDVNILVITNVYPTPTEPERGVFTHQLIKTIQRDHNVTVVCPLPWFPSFWPFNRIRKYKHYALVPKQYDYDNIKVYSPKYILFPKLSESIHAYLLTIGIRKCVKSLHKSKPFSVIHSHWLYPDGVAASAISEELRIPHLMTGLGCDINISLYQRGKRPKILSALALADSITVKANNLKLELVKNGVPESRVEVIPNGIDLNKFSIMNRNRCRELLGMTADGPIILFIGRLSTEKDVNTLISAAGLLKDTEAMPTIYLVGDGPLRHSLSSHATNLGIADNVIFCGRVEHNKLKNWLGAADYLCLPSLREGCPNVVLEALACGKPVIGSRVGAIPDLVAKDSGVLFEPGNAEDLARAIREATDLQWDQENIRAGVSQFTWDSAAKNYDRLYGSISNDHKVSLESSA